MPEKGKGVNEFKIQKLIHNYSGIKILNEYFFSYNVSFICLLYVKSIVNKDNQ